MREKPGAPPQSSDETRINEQIRVREVRLIDENGQQVGVVSRDMALQRAQEAGLDLVEVAPDARPPVCKVMDYAKFKYQKAIRERLARKKQVRIDIKEIKFRPGTDDHDFDVKMRSVKKFLEDGDKVKCTLRFRGREMTHQELGLTLLQKVEEGVAEIGKVEQEPKLLGKQMVMVIAPTARKKVSEGGKPRSVDAINPDIDDNDDEDDDED